ncbi:MAG TPA: 4Fe-4S dicluster domain-containing protein [Phycisphaerae bacterium]|nr:4Fe-4S dicluster domain-containing protein [Phycisphaerae bacterium]HOJ74491.1 4Fe-4S dicluster domain-containing protein [Phycisphaerae bacterium]HOM53312.1 4Fe-4S dicluster domain-containing protein [Phycisphaerae bacterium]HOQ87509.1 4Fe-4S dicluster domain-containing protein [Phycisphaerae bacterium]HPP28558.1 4Fe-4S dicluster domain-containing protein [Phycisphaerae bacterium]
MRITTVRIIVQTLMMSLFLAFVFVTTFAWLEEAPALKFWVSKFLEIDPLVAAATVITTHTLYKGLAWALVLLIPTLFLGRIFCNWICPYGIMHQFTGWLFNRRNAKQRIESNRYRRLYALKYYILIGMIVAAIFGSLQIGLLDPICLLYRSFSTSILPALNMPGPVARVVGDPKEHQLAWVIGFLILFLVSMNLVIPRFFCRVLCPLGATLGVLSRFAIWRIERDPNKCTDCDLCLQSCEGASDPHTQLRKSECFVCFNCIEDCPHDALSFALLPPRKHEIAWPDLPKRRAIYAGVVGVLFYPFAKLAGKTTKDFSAKVVRPPGSVEEREFLERCIKCDQCIRVCPTNVLQPAMFEAGIEGIWTPVMNFRMGFCQLNCTACGQVCPTGAIQRLTIEQKLGYGPHAQDGPVKLGTAHYDLGRCLPWSKNIPCVVCEEVCPTSPKAIHSEYRQLLIRDGKKQVTASTPVTVTLADYPPPGMAFGEACTFRPGEFKGDQTTSYHVRVIHRDGTSETHRILNNDADTLLIGEIDPVGGEVISGSRFTRPPARGAIVEINLEFKLPKIDTQLCIGCGLCEMECPVVGDRRAVYVTPEGETRSQHYLERERNRSVRLLKTADAAPVRGGGTGSGVDLSGMILPQRPGRGRHA